jgi:hypothetical protein
MGVIQFADKFDHVESGVVFGGAYRRENASVDR